MKKVFILLVSLIAMMSASLSAKAQEVTINLSPGWNWISYPNAVAMEVNEALASFTPMEGDMVKGPFSFTTYFQGQWTGGLTHFTPGMGYLYCSLRTEATSFVFAQASSVSVVTATPTDITTVSARVGSTVTIGAGNHVFHRGLCWGTGETPTVDDNHTYWNPAAGNQTVTLDMLSPNTTYYVRAYVVTDYGLAYGNTLTFTTPSGIPAVTTAEVTDITATGANCGGTVTDDGGLTVTARGVCWSTDHNPTLSDNHTTDGTGMGSFSSTLTDLTPNTTYYVRAYASNSYETVYGNEVSFTTIVPIGAIDGLFSVSATQQVYFSQGNLQYQASTNTWKFADNQYDCIGSDNGNISSIYSGWIDLFGWGTSGWNNGNTYYHPWDSDNSSGSTYGPPGQNDLTGSYANADWGVYNPIINGGNTANQWRTLTRWEWDYVFNTRTTTSGIRYAKANVNNVNGVILLPDDWSSSIYSLSNTNSNDASFSSNTLTASQWSILEQAGAVFLSAAGYRRGTSVSGVDSYGFYWSTSYNNSNHACYVFFNDSFLSPSYSYNRFDGRSVRLVYVVE